MPVFIEYQCNKCGITADFEHSDGWGSISLDPKGRLYKSFFGTFYFCPTHYNEIAEMFKPYKEKK